MYYSISKNNIVEDHEEILMSSIYKVVISVCLFVCPIITQEPLNRFASNFDWGNSVDLNSKNLVSR